MNHHHTTALPRRSAMPHDTVHTLHARSNVAVARWLVVPVAFTVLALQEYFSRDRYLLPDWLWLAFAAVAMASAAPAAAWACLRLGPELGVTPAGVWVRRSPLRRHVVFVEWSRLTQVDLVEVRRGRLHLFAGVKLRLHLARPAPELPERSRFTPCREQEFADVTAALRERSPVPVSTPPGVHTR